MIVGSKPAPRAAARKTIAVQGARVHNLKNISLEIPRDALIVVTGLSGSGKSSLAFDTIYAEGQRRYMESLSSYAKRFVAQVAKPDVDFVFGLSPVISIEQKTTGSNPRSTVGTMTDVASYLNLLFATIGQAHCPRTGEPTPSRTASQILEAILSLPEGTEVELRAPVFPIYGEDVDVLYAELRKKGVRRVIVDGEIVDLADRDEPDASDDAGAESESDGGEATPAAQMDAIVDRFIVGRKHEKAIKAGIAATLLIGDGLMQVQVLKGAFAEARRTAKCRSVLQRHVQRDASSRVRRHRAGVLSVQQSRKCVPHVRRPRRGQAHASGPAHTGSRPQHSRRLLRARGVQVQPGHVGRPADVQPVAAVELPARLPVEAAAGSGSRNDPLRPRAPRRSR